VGLRNTVRFLVPASGSTSQFFSSNIFIYCSPAQLFYFLRFGRLPETTAKVFSTFDFLFSPPLAAASGSNSVS
jgi:hypothetical protein